jgi:hypothetical protein
MPEREWTGSVAVLPESLRKLAIDMANLANAAREQLEVLDASLYDDEVQQLQGLADAQRAFLAGHAYTLREWAVAVEQLYARRDESLNAQGLALARLMAGRRGERVNILTNATFTLPEGWWLATFECGFECGIAPDGSVSS